MKYLRRRRHVGDDCFIIGEIKTAVLTESDFTALTPINQPVRCKIGYTCYYITYCGHLTCRFPYFLIPVWEFSSGSGSTWNTGVKFVSLSSVQQFMRKLHIILYIIMWFCVVTFVICFLQFMCVYLCFWMDAQTHNLSPTYGPQFEVWISDWHTLKDTFPKM